MNKITSVLVNRRRDERGAMAILFAVFSLVLFVLCALVVDLGQARDVRRQSQNAADAAALAAANRLYSTGTLDLAAGTAEAVSYAQKNLNVSPTAWASCTDPAPLAVASGTNCISYDSATAPTQVRVYLPRQNVSFGFAKIVGVGSTSVGALAQAQVSTGAKAVCGLCVIGPGVHDIQNGDVTVDGASVYINGSLQAQNNGSITVTGTGSGISVQGTVSNKGTFSPTPATNQPAIADPLAFLSLPPSYAGLSNKTGTACTGGPGIYYDSFQFSGNCTLSPGLYVLAGASQEHESGQTNVKAIGVTMYFTCKQTSPTLAPRACNANEAGAGVLFTGQASLTISAPTSGATQGLAIVSDRNNTQTFGFRGNGTDPSSGTIYAASGTFDYRGNGNGPALDALIVIKDLTFSGNNAALNSQYTKEKNLGMPPTPPYLTK